MRHVLYVKLVLIVVVLTTAAWALGTEPWGPG
jgi:hypothetical protein